MRKGVTYGQLRRALSTLGFSEIRRAGGVKLEHKESDTFFLFRPYRQKDRLQPGEIMLVTQQLDERGLMPAETFEAMLFKTPTG